MEGLEKSETRNFFGLNLSVLSDDDYKVEMEKQEKQRVSWFKAEIESHYRSSKSGVNERYWNESLDTFIAVTEEEKHNLDTIRKYVSIPHNNKILLLSGNFGTGKTHLGCAIIRELGGKYITSLKLCIEYETGADYKAEKNKLQILEEYSSYPMLVIDEIGRGLKEQTEKEILSYVINERYERLLPTVLITNMPKSDFKSYIGKASFDRLTETCVSLDFTGKSKRIEKRVM